MPSVADRVRRFIIDDLGWEGTADELPGDLPLIRAGVLDSLAVLMLVQFLESTYGIVIDDGEVTPAHLGTLAGIEGYMAAKRAAAGLVPTEFSRQ
jgi:acyl carrier protein